MSEDILLMMKDIPVMRINFDHQEYEVLDELHIPYQLKGKLSLDSSLIVSVI